MKTLFSFLAVALFILASSFASGNQKEISQDPTASVSSSTDGSFNYLRVHRMGKAGVSLSWSVGTNDITHFIVERSYDGEYFESADAVSYNGSSSYKFNDTNVYPGTIYYGIIAIKSDGTTEHSPVQNVRIVQRG